MQTVSNAAAVAAVLMPFTWLRRRRTGFRSHPFIALVLSPPSAYRALLRRPHHITPRQHNVRTCYAPLNRNFQQGKPANGLSSTWAYTGFCSGG